MLPFDHVCTLRPDRPTDHTTHFVCSNRPHLASAAMRPNNREPERRETEKRETEKRETEKKETERRETLPGQEKRETEKGKSFTLNVQSYRSMPRTRYE